MFILYYTVYSIAYLRVSYAYKFGKLDTREIFYTTSPLYLKFCRATVNIYYGIKIF